MAMEGDGALFSWRWRVTDARDSDEAVDLSIGRRRREMIYDKRHLSRYDTFFPRTQDHNALP